MAKTKRLRTIIVWEYDAEEDMYDTADVVEMASIDQDNWLNVPELCLQLLQQNWDKEEITVKVEPVD